MSRSMKFFVIGVSLVVVVAVAAGFGFSTADDDEPLTGAQLERATAAALAATGGGEVVGSEVGDDEGAAFEVEIRLPDGSQVEVQLDADFVVIATDADDDGTGDEDESE